MTKEEAIKVLNTYDVNFDGYRAEEIADALDMAIDALKAEETIEIKPMEIKGEFHIDDIDKAKTSSQLLDDLAVDMVNAMGRRIVEVVRCKDCRHHGMRDCPVWGDDTTEDYMWCYYGERSEE